MVAKYDKATQCDGKIPYDSGNAAAHALKQLQKRTGGVSHNVYRCAYCQHWHIGRKRKGVSYRD